MATAVAENIDCANRWNARQLQESTYLRSLQMAGVSIEGLEDLPAQMRAHLDAVVEQLPARLALFGEGAFKRELDLRLAAKTKISDGSWDLEITGQDPDGGVKTEKFRLQWSGEYAGRFHLFVLSSPGATGVIPTIVDEASVIRELAIYTFGRQIPGTPLSRYS